VKRRMSFAMSSPFLMVALLSTSLMVAYPITFVGNISGSGEPNFMDGIVDVHVAGNYAYTISSYDEAFNIIDVTEPASPVLAVSIRGYHHPHYISSPRAIDVVGDLAYVLSIGFKKPGITIFDISTPESPTVLGYIYNYHFVSANTIKVDGNYAYVIQGPNSWISVVDISNPTHPKFICILTLDTTPFNVFPFDIDISGNYAFVPGAQNNTLYVIDISDPPSLHIVSTISGAGEPNFLNGPTGVRTIGDYAFATAVFDNSLTVINVSDPLAPKFISHITGEGSPNFLSGARHLHISGNYAYIVAAEDSALTIVDISNPLTPTVVDSIQGAGAPNYLDYPLDVFVYFNHAFVAASWDDSLSIFELGPVQAIHNIMDELGDLAQDGVIDNGQYQSLISKLENALKKLNEDKQNIAIEQLNNFIGKVNSLIDNGDLSLEEGNLYINATNYIINQLR
jgi:hypothetical protein